MYKLLINRYLCLILLFLASTYGSSQSLVELYQTKSLSFSEKVEGQLFLSALSSFPEVSEEQRIWEESDVQKNKLISLIHANYPELLYEVEGSDLSVLSLPEVSKLLVSHIKEDSGSGLVPENMNIADYSAQYGLNKKDISTLLFYEAYELLKKKKLVEAQKLFDKVARVKGKEYQYALYYSGLISMLSNDMESAYKRLRKIRNAKEIKPYLPYYLAAIHYALGDYSDIVRYYKNVLKNNNYEHREELIEIVALAYYRLGSWDLAISHLEKIKRTPLFNSENQLVLASCYMQIGQFTRAEVLLGKIMKRPGNLGLTARFNYGVVLANNQRESDAITHFELMLKNDPGSMAYRIRWNLAILYSQSHDYSNAVAQANALKKFETDRMSSHFLSSLLAQISDDEAFFNIASENVDKGTINSEMKLSIYSRALSALKSGKSQSAKKYFALLKKADPMDGEKSTIAAWEGIMAYYEGDYELSIIQLQKYISNKKTTAVSTKLNFDARYFLGYSYFRLKKHKESLGYFSGSFEILRKKDIPLLPPQIDALKEDVLVRLGDCYFLMDKYVLSKKCYSDALDTEGHQGDYALYQLALLSDLENKTYDQIVYLTELMDDYPHSKFIDKSHYYKATALFDLSKYEKAASEYRALIKRNPSRDMRERSVMQLGLISVNAGDFKMAENYYNRIIENSANAELVSTAKNALKEIYGDYVNDVDAYLNLITSDETLNKVVEVDSVLYDLAKENFDNAKYSDAIIQFEKLIVEYTSSKWKSFATYYLAVSYDKLEDWSLAVSSYQNATALGLPLELHKKSDRSVDRILFVKLKNWEDYVSYIDSRNVELLGNSDELNYRKVMSLLQLGRIEQIDDALIKDIVSSNITLSEKRKVIDEIFQYLLTESRWRDVVKISSLGGMDLVINITPKHIYYRSLSYMNSNRYDEAISSVTDHYTTLLDDPAWLAKSIILLADIYYIKGDHESATGALEALIESDGKIPQSLIRMAIERMESLKLKEKVYNTNTNSKSIGDED